MGKSAVSERFVVGTQRRLSELMRRDLRGLALVALMIDGVHFAEHVVLAAVGIESKGLADRFMQRLCAIDHHQDGTVGIKPALDQVSQQRLAGRGVLGRSFPQPQYVLVAVRRARPDSPVPRAQEAQRH